MLEPVVKERVIPAEPGQVFDRFTRGIATWWPLATHSVWEGDAASVHIEGRVGGRFVERHRDGRESVWGTVTHWEPPHRISFTWHPDREPATAQQVDVTFEPADGGTRLRLVHSGWEALGEMAAQTRAGYEGGWEGVLGLFTRTFDAAGSE